MSDTDASGQPSLPQLRDQIDAIDERIHQLICQRAHCAQQVAQIKANTQGESVTFYRPEREAQILNRIMQRNNGPLADEDMARLFREIMSACLALEQPIQVAYLGPQGTFTQQAAVKHFGQWAQIHPFSAIDEVFREVEAGAVQYGVVPVENSTEGMVNHTLDTFLTSNLKISGEVELRIHHYLMIGPHTQPDNISRVYSHQQPLAQCRKWLDAHLPRAERVAVSSNGEAARRVNGEWNAAAIAGIMAAQQYGLTVLHEKIEDTPDNSTRFLIIGKTEVAPSGRDKTSIIVAMRNEPGALYHLLKPIYDAQIDMTRLESRPSRSGTWSYVFFIDFIGHIQDDNVRRTLDIIRQSAVEVKVLGSYPIAVL